MSGMGDQHLGRVFMVCGLLLVLSLAGHFVADVVCAATQTEPQCGRVAPQEATTASHHLESGLHTGFTWLGALFIITPIALLFAADSLRLLALARFITPPLHPPRLPARHIA